MAGKPRGRCALSGAETDECDLTHIALLRPKLAEFIIRRHPHLDSQSKLSARVLNDFRSEYVRALLESEIGELSALEEDVLRSLRDHELITERDDVESDATLTFGERLSDRIAAFGGSWRFIIGFTGLLLVWILVNSVLLASRSFDPYPFILLNLILSCVAALQAPVIMMSQNRQEARDRKRAESDYKINLKAELEIQHINEKLDHLLKQNLQKLLDIEEVQVDLLREISASGRVDRPAVRDVSARAASPRNTGPSSPTDSRSA